ncbi:MAG: hypothetical protein ABIN96_05925 [Rubrivivax sp.]
MSQTFGLEAPGDSRRGDGGQGAAPARYLILIDSASEARRLAKVLAADRSLVAEFDASAPEVQLMCRGIEPQHSAEAPQWDSALAGHASEERRAAEIYHLDT